jgi:hypothetical protein
VIIATVDALMGSSSSDIPAGGCRMSDHPAQPLFTAARDGPRSTSVAGAFAAPLEPRQPGSEVRATYGSVLTILTPRAVFAPDRDGAVAGCGRDRAGRGFRRQPGSRASRVSP